MNIKVQMGMVLNLDKCLACHTCSIPCKNAWTTAPGTEYMWFNNVETKPGVGYPKEWENQDRYKGGWEIRDGKLHLRAGGKTDKLANIFANPDLPALDDYYEPWKYDYERLTDSPASRHQPWPVPIRRSRERRSTRSGAATGRTTSAARRHRAFRPQLRGARSQGLS